MMLVLAVAVMAVALGTWGLYFLGRGGWARVTAGLYYLSPAISVGLPISVVWSLLTAPYVMWRDGRWFRLPVVWLTILFALLNASAYLWSPQPMSALLYGVGPMLAVAFVFAGTIGSVARFPGLVPSVLAVLSPIVLAEAVSTIVFRISPEIESSYYASSPALLLLGPKTRQLSDGVLVNNVLFPEKAGGILFLNGNRASMVLGVTALVYAMYALARRSNLAWVIAVVAATGCGFSGSKTGLALLVAVPLIALFLAAFTGSSAPGRILSIVGLIGVSAVAVWGVLNAADDYIVRSQTALIPRRELWSTATDAWLTHPWRGLGFGGWENYANARLPSLAFEQVAIVVFPEDYPPHNSILFSLTRIGILGGVLILLITFAGIMTCIRGIESHADFATRLAMTCGAGTWIWVFTHGMGDNTEVFGTFQSLPMLALAMGFCVLLRSPREPGEDDVPQESAEITATSSGV